MKASTVAKGLFIGASILVAGLCPLAGVIAGTYLGVTAATTTAGAVGLGILGFIGGGIAGRIAGKIVSFPARLLVAASTVKAATSKKSDFFNFSGSFDNKKIFGTSKLTDSFTNQNSRTNTLNAATTAHKHTFKMGR